MDESLEMAEAMVHGFKDLIKVEKTEQGVEIETFLHMSDGEPITIVCQQRDGRHVLTDLGCTTFWLEKQLVELTPWRKMILEGVVRDYHARLEGTEIILDCSRYPESDLTRMICALLRASDIVLLDQRTVRSVFLEDVKSMFTERFPDCEVSKKVSNSRARASGPMSSSPPRGLSWCSPSAPEGGADPPRWRSWPSPRTASTTAWWSWTRRGRCRRTT